MFTKYLFCFLVDKELNKLVDESILSSISERYSQILSNDLNDEFKQKNC